MPGQAELRKQLGASLWEAATTPLVSQGVARTAHLANPVTAPFELVRRYAAAKLPQEINSGNPIRAALAQFFSGSINDTEELGRSMTSPVNLALLATEVGPVGKAVGALGTAVKGLRAAATGYFAIQSAKDAFTGKLPGENDADELERRALGAAGLLTLSMSGAVHTTESLHSILENHFGLTGKLADRVAEHVQKIHALDQELRDFDHRDALAEYASERNVQAMEERLSILPDEIRQRGAVLQDEYARAVDSERARIGQDFDAVEKSAGDKPVVKGSDIYDVMVKGMERRGIPHEIAHQTAQNILVKNAGTPGDLTWGEASYLRNRLWDRALGTEDLRSGAAMMEGIGAILDKQEELAGKLGMGDKFKNARSEWRVLATNTQDHAIGKKLAAHVSREDIIASHQIADMMESPKNLSLLKGLFNAVGVDTAPLESLQEELAGMGEAKKAAARPELVTGRERTPVARSLREANTPERGRSAVVPGTEYRGLEGLSEHDLRERRVRAMMEQAKSLGITKPHNYLILGYGLSKILAGNLWGLLISGYGGGRLFSDQLISNPRWANWIARESGVTDGAWGRKALRGIASAAATSGANQ